MLMSPLANKRQALKTLCERMDVRLDGTVSLAMTLSTSA